MPNSPVPSTGSRWKVVLAAAAVAGLQAWGAGPAVAEADEATLRFTCTVDSFPGQSVTARLNWTAPDSVVAGQPTPALSIGVTTTLSPVVTDAAAFIHVASVEGRIDATGVVATPEGEASVDVPLTVPRTEVPDSGPMTIRATGTVPGQVFNEPGPATVTIGRDFAVRVDLKDASGGPAAIPHLDISCVLDSGQDTVLAEFEIVAGARGPATGGWPMTPAAPVPSPPSTGTHPMAAPGAAPEVPGTAGGDPREATAGAVSPTAALADTGGTRTWLLGSVILAVVASGCSWWLVRRRRA